MLIFKINISHNIIYGPQVYLAVTKDIHELTHPRHVDIVAAELRLRGLPLHSEAGASEYCHPEEDINNRTQHCSSDKILQNIYKLKIKILKFKVKVIV